jgi:hypothetical protein
MEETASAAEAEADSMASPADSVALAMASEAEELSKVVTPLSAHRL